MDMVSHSWHASSRNEYGASIIILVRIISKVLTNGTPCLLNFGALEYQNPLMLISFTEEIYFTTILSLVYVRSRIYIVLWKEVISCLENYYLSLCYPCNMQSSDVCSQAWRILITQKVSLWPQCWSSLSLGYWDSIIHGTETY